jgi:cell shape-determining protein MreC
MELQGKLIFKSEVQQVTEKFIKRDFVIETNEQYPQQIKFELHQDRTDLIDVYNINETITVSFNLRGRSYTDKQGETQYSNTLQAWKIQR